MSALPKVRTDFDPKPIPLRQFDWIAWYDGEEDEQYDHAYGRTEAEAVVDLLENHPRGVWCEHQRCCGTCEHFTEEARPFRDDPYFTVYVCGLRHRRTDSENVCAEHDFGGERGQTRTLPPVTQDEIAF